jgi:hypothetical protein
MTNNNTSLPTFASHAERLAYFSASKPDTTPLDHPARRLPPRPRRNSVRHRAIR